MSREGESAILSLKLAVDRAMLVFWIHSLLHRAECRSKGLNVL
jgi:hypothetical protein